MNVRVVLFPEGEDPDSYARNHTTSETESLIKDTAVDFIKFKTNLLKDETEGDPVGRATLIKEIVNSIALIPDAITRSLYVKECSVLLEMPEQTLVNELNKLLRKKFSNQYRDVPESRIEVPPAEQFKPIEIDPLDTIIHEKDLIRLLLLYGNEKVTITDDSGDIELSVASCILEDLENDGLYFTNKECVAVADEVKKYVSYEKEIDIKLFTNHENQEIAGLAIDILTSPYELSANWEKNNIFVKKEEDDLYNRYDGFPNGLQIKAYKPKA